MRDFEAVESALVERITECADTVGIRTVKAYQHEFDVDDLSHVRGPFPAVFVTFIRSGTTPHGNRLHEVLEYDILVGDRSLHSDEAARLGHGGRPGVYAMLRAVRRQLARGPVLPGLSLATPVETVPLFRGRGLCVFAIRITVEQDG